MASWDEIDDTTDEEPVPRHPYHPQPWSLLQRQRVETYGHYLCEVCLDALTDEVLPAAESPTGEEMAICTPCQAKRKGHRGNNAA